tara:strand:+ start:12279 stop:13670 length:1392 start_codon:yes stop_codon:yes gene_type:complete
MKKTTLSTFILATLFTQNIIAEERVVVYDNYGYLFSKKDITVNDNYLLELPSSVDSSSLNINFKYSNKNIPILNKTIQNNSINTLYYQNIGKNINFYINNQKIEGKLLSISNNFIKIKVKNEIFTEFRYYNINSLYGVSFEKDFNFSNKVFDIDLQNDKEKTVELSYSARFNQIDWKPHYRFLINDKTNIGYFDYDITIDNRSSYLFKDINLELLSGNIYQTNNYNKGNIQHKSYTMNEMMDTSPAQDFDNFSGYQRLIFDNKITLEPFSSNTYPYLDDKKLSYEKIYTYKDYAGSHFENKNPKIEINIERDKQEEQFPLMSGNISVFNGEELYNSTFIGASNIGTKSKSENIRFSIGQSQNIYISKSINTDKRKYYINNKQSYMNIHKVSLSITNDEKNDIELIYKLNSNAIILSQEEYEENFARNLDNIFVLKKKYKNNNSKIINIKKESTSKEYFYIIEV